MNPVLEHRRSAEIDRNTGLPDALGDCPKATNRKPWAADDGGSLMASKCGEEQTACV